MSKLKSKKYFQVLGTYPTSTQRSSIPGTWRLNPQPCMRNSGH
jgi:hypothetical protein